jgi:uridine kinase
MNTLSIAVCGPKYAGKSAFIRKLCADYPLKSVCRYDQRSSLTSKKTVLFYETEEVPLDRRCYDILIFYEKPLVDVVSELRNSALDFQDYNEHHENITKSRSNADIIIPSNDDSVGILLLKSYIDAFLGKHHEKEILY